MAKSVSTRKEQSRITPAQSTSQVQEWRSLTESVRLSCSELQSCDGQQKAIVDRITQLFLEIDHTMRDLSDLVCSSCADVCCQRATLWYDMKDLLYIYLLTGTLPKEQITRNEAGACCNLEATGCRLQRMHRPFICTWYICPEMRRHLVDETLLKRIEEVKRLRKQLAAVVQYVESS